MCRGRRELDNWCPMEIREIRIELHQQILEGNPSVRLGELTSLRLSGMRQTSATDLSHRLYTANPSDRCSGHEAEVFQDRTRPQ